MSLYKDIATPLAKRGVPTIPLRPHTKEAFLPDWQNIATTDENKIAEWDALYPESNSGSVARAEIGGVWFLELDDPSLSTRIEHETGQPLPKTFRVRSSPGKGHFYFKQNQASLAMGNVWQSIVKGNNFSARVSNGYVVSPGSWHPTSGQKYEVVSESEIIECPEWLIEWIIRQRIDSGAEAKPVDLNINSNDRIPRGAHDNTLTAIAGKLRSIGLEEQSIYAAIVEACEKRCDNYGSDYKEMCAKIAKSVCRYKPGMPVTAYFGNQKQSVLPVPVTPPIEVVSPEDEPEYQLNIDYISHPKFPKWIMADTSIYEGFAKPYCDVNSRYEEFMFMPAFALMLNYIGTKVKVHMKNMIPSIFMVLIGKRGEVIKSSSVQDAITYFNQMGFCDHAGAHTKNAEGKSLVWSAGSPEGLGIDMQRTNCKNVVLFYDELSILTNKASIESSTLTSNLLLLYESGKYQNKIKAGKESYSIDPGTYCATLIACCTDKNFLPNWAKMQGKSNGLDDRFFFLYQPEELKMPTPQIAISTFEGSMRTKKLIEKAVNQGIYKITDSSPLAHQMSRGTIDNREGIRVEKFALGFAIDLDKEEIDEECIERALALIKYEKEVKKFLAPFEAVTMQGGIQLEVINILKKNRGRMAVESLNKILHPERLGSDVWMRAWAGLINLGYMKTEGKGTKGSPFEVVLLRAPENDDE